MDSTSRIRRGARVIAVVAGVGVGVGVGCGPAVMLEDDATGTIGADPTGSSTTSPGTTTAPTSTTAPGTTTPPPPDETTTGPDDTGIPFLDGLDGWDENWSNLECDVFVQDCPPGEKCMPWAGDGGAWNATRCFPVARDPAGVGEPCLVEGGPLSGIDTCDYGSMCWNVDSETLQGICVAFCLGSADAPVCEDETTACMLANDDVLALCLPKCDPLVQDCVAGEACYPFDDLFMCAPDASGDTGAVGDPCAFINVCDAGGFCSEASLVPECLDPFGCCSAYCDLGDPMPPCLPGQDCVPWYEPGAAPMGYQNVGACALPM